MLWQPSLISSVGRPSLVVSWEELWARQQEHWVSSERHRDTRPSEHCLCPSKLSSSHRLAPLPPLSPPIPILDDSKLQNIQRSNITMNNKHFKNNSQHKGVRRRRSCNGVATTDTVLSLALGSHRYRWPWASSTATHTKLPSKSSSRLVCGLRVPLSLPSSSA